MVVVQNFFSKYFIGELEGSNSRVHRLAKDAKKFESEDAAKKHVRKLIKLDAGVTSLQDVVFVSV